MSYSFICQCCRHTKTSERKNAIYCSAPECQKARKDKNRKKSEQKNKNHNTTVVAQNATLINELYQQNEELKKQNENLTNKVRKLAREVIQYRARYAVDLETGEI